MDKATESSRLRLLIGLVGVALAAAAIWAAAPLAADGSSGSGGSDVGTPPAANVQQEERGPNGEDCPDKDRDASAQL